MAGVTHAGQKAKLQFSLETFERNMKQLQQFTDEELDKVLNAGASAYATSASKHTPPDMGKPKISPRFYADGYLMTRQDRSVRLGGVRPVYDLIALVKRADTRGKRIIGEKIREGYRYSVKVRGKQWVYCRTEVEAAAAAHETYRGLMRAAWGLGMDKIGQKIPQTVRQLISLRPRLGQISGLFNVVKNKARHEVSILNAVADGGFFATTDTNASIACARTMNDMIGRILKNRTVNL